MSEYFLNQIVSNSTGMYIPDTSTTVGIITLILTVIVLKYTKDTLDLTKREQEAGNIQESLDKFYIPLFETLTQPHFDNFYYRNVIPYNYLADEDIRDKFIAFLNDKPNVDGLYGEEWSNAMVEYQKEKSAHLGRLLIEIENRVNKKEERLNELRNR
jgi:hypothetical protein